MENAVEVFKGYVQRLAEKLKIEGLQVDDENTCYLAFDEKFFVRCSFDKEKEQIEYLGYIGALPEDGADYYQGILESCHFWRDTAGSNVSFDPEDGTLTLQQFCDINFMNDDYFYKVMEDFVNAMDHWNSKRRQEWEEHPTASPSTDVPAAGPVGIDPNMMMFGA
ncbi:MAG: type III secretion system chaperone [Verrucomicrobiota bacterium]|nr:MAG: type III secretion system chaperone [Verrucomicrobiota bacterium]